MNQIEVQIMQQSYRLACPEGQQERLLQAVERVDAAMVRIRDAGKVRARERIAVLAALNLAFELADQARAAAAPPAEAPAMEAPGRSSFHGRLRRHGCAGHPCPAACRPPPGLPSAACWPRARHRTATRCRRCCGAWTMRWARTAGRPDPALPKGASRAYNGGVRSAAGLYISLNQCSMSKGLVHRPVSVIISRQMNPTPGCPRPPEPPVQDDGPVATADTFSPERRSIPAALLHCGPARDDGPLQRAHAGGSQPSRATRARKASAGNPGATRKPWK